VPYAAKAWADLQRPDEGVVRFDHDHYLKIWALSDPKIPADFLLLDEAQDTNPVVEQVFTAQRAHAQLVMVGDSAQAIYGWRGARDVMTGFDGTASPCRSPSASAPASPPKPTGGSPSQAPPSAWTEPRPFPPNSAPSTIRTPSCAAPTSAPSPKSCTTSKPVVGSPWPAAEKPCVLWPLPPAT
jgi:hypothetical protein